MKAKCGRVFCVIVSFQTLCCDTEVLLYCLQIVYCLSVLNSNTKGLFVRCFSKTHRCIFRLTLLVNGWFDTRVQAVLLVKASYKKTTNYLEKRFRVVYHW